MSVLDDQDMDLMMFGKHINFSVSGGWNLNTNVTDPSRAFTSYVTTLESARNLSPGAGRL